MLYPIELRVQSGGLSRQDAQPNGRIPARQGQAQTVRAQEFWRTSYSMD
jgi:hypothetical protein